MDIKDLSVGDWVCIHPALRPTNCEVVKIYKSDLITALRPNGVIERVHTNAIVPIPITVSILEKSGFERCRPVSYAYEYQRRDYGKSIGVCSFDGEIWFVDFETEGGVFSNINIPLRYVHQLQHTLRLLGAHQPIIQLCQWN